jgi:ferredoxin-thioredoxin reductase catalytic subunit
MKLVLKNGRVIYGVIKELHQKGIVFIPVQIKKKKEKADAQWFCPLFPIFLPFFFFIPFFFFF